jgi:hypothetical protein
MARFCSVLAGFVVALLLIASPASGQEKQYELSNFDVTVHLDPNGGATGAAGAAGAT